MKTKNLILFLIGMAPLVSCSDKSGVVEEVSLQGQLVDIKANVGKWPKWMFGDNIYARDRDFSLHSGRLTETEWQKAEQVFVRGHGHNEFGMMSLSQGHDGALYVLDLPFEGGKLVSLTKIQHPDNVATVKNPANWEKYDLRQLPPFLQVGDNFLILSDSTILVTGAPANDMHHVLSIINFKEQTVTPLDYWLEDDTPESLLESKWIVYTDGSGLKDNGKGKYLYWNDSGRLAFIFAIDGAKMNVLNYLYSDRLPVPRKDKTPSTVRIACCSDDDSIYLLYRNRNSKGEIVKEWDGKDPFPMGNTVEVYDWDGVKRRVLHLDQQGRKIMLSKDGKTLYLYSEYLDNSSDPYIYSYDL